MLKILITGCSGFIGSHLTSKLVENENYEIIGLDINPFSNDCPFLSKIKFYKEDINNDILYSIINEKPDLVIHLAAMAGVGYSCSNPCKYIDVNIKGTTNLIQKCLENNIKKIIYASSSSVYGNEDNLDIFETTFHLQSPYSITKKACEMIFDYYSRMNGLSCIGLRFFSVYGPNGRKDMAPYIFIDSILNDKVITIHGDGSILRDFTYISDIVDGISSSIEFINDDKKCLKHEVFNLGNNNAVSIHHFIHIIEEIVNKKALLQYGESKNYDNKFTLADLKKSSDLLNYNPVVDLHKGLLLTIEDYILHH